MAYTAGGWWHPNWGGQAPVLFPNCGSVRDDAPLFIMEDEGVIEGLEYKENEKGTQWFSFTVNLINENKKYFANVYFSGKMAAMNLKKFINIIYNLTGEALTSLDFANEVALAQRLNDELIGKDVVIELTTKKEFQNFKFIFQE